MTRDLLSRQGLRRAGHLLIDEANSMTDESVRAMPGYLDMPTRDMKKFSIVKAIRMKREEIMGCAGAFDGIEAESHAALVERFGMPLHGGSILVPADVLGYDPLGDRRDLNVAQLGAGGALVGSSNYGSFIAVLRNRAVAFLLGARSMPGLRENVTVARQTGASTLVWQATETSTATESTPTFAQITATPKTAIAYNEISGLLLKQSNPAADMVVMNGLAGDIAVGADGAVLAGSGVAGQPVGILNTSGIGTASGTSLAYAGLVSPQTTVCNANAVLNGATLGYVTTPDVASLLKNRQRFSGTDSPLWRGSVYAGEIEGIPAYSSKQIPASTLLFGDFSSVVVAEWGVLEVQVNPFADFQKRIVGIRAIWSLDVLVTAPTSFVTVTSVT